MLQILEVSCESSTLGGILRAVKNMINLIQILAPLVLLIMAAIHLFALMRNPDDKKRIPKLKNSFIAAAVIFFIPMLVNLVMQLLGSSTTISDCWNSNSNINLNPTYVEPYETNKKSGLITTPDDYEKGSPKPSSSSDTSSSPKPSGSTDTIEAPEDSESKPSVLNDSRYSKYQTIASCDGTTLKYKIINASNQDIVIIWVKNPSKQLNGALAAANSIGRASAEQMLNNEINSYNLQNKCLVAVNASFFSYSTASPLGGVVINKGKIVKNKDKASGCIGVNSSNKLIECSHKTAEEIAQKGVRNTFVISSPAGKDNSGDKANRTQICQIDTNNFVLISGSGTVGGVANIARSVTGCGTVYNLDGGGSRKLYYKTQNGSLTKRFGGDRTLPDMLYFAEM